MDINITNAILIGIIGIIIITILNIRMGLNFKKQKKLRQFASVIQITHTHTKSYLIMLQGQAINVFLDQ